MNAEQLLDAIDKLDDELLEGVPVERLETARRYTDNNFFVSRARAKKHCKWMISQMHVFLQDGYVDKANRWLGFVQGALWATGVASIDYFREMNSKS